MWGHLQGTRSRAAATNQRCIYSWPRWCVFYAVVLLGSLIILCGSEIPVVAEQDAAVPILQALRSHDFAEAIAMSRSALAVSPGDYRIWTLRGMASGGNGDLTGALVAYQHALRLRPGYLAAEEGAAQTEFQMGRDARPVLRQVLSQRPGDPNAHMLLGILDSRYGNCSRAVDHFHKAEVVIDHDPEALTDDGVCLASVDRPKEAVRVLREALTLAPEASFAQYNLALAEFDAHDLDEALLTLSPLVVGSSTHANALVLAAKIEEAKGDTERAVTDLRSALLANPEDLDAYMQFASLSFDHASPQVGVDILNEGIGQMPDQPRLYLVRGILLAQIGKFAQAAGDFDKAAKLDPRLEFLRDSQGLVESQEHNSAAALSRFRAAVKAHPQEAYGWYLLAEALSSEGAPKGSAEQLEEMHAATTAVELDPKLVAARDLLSGAYFEEGNIQASIRQSKAAIAIDPKDEQAVYHLMLAQRHLGHNRQASALVQELLELRSEAKAGRRSKPVYRLYEQGSAGVAARASGP